MELCDEPLASAIREEADETDDAPPFEAAGRDLLVHATGDIAGLAHPDPLPIDYDEIYWYPPRAGTLVIIGTVELPDRMIVDSPDDPSESRVFAFRPGTYEVVGLDEVDRSSLPLAIVRLPGVAIARWRYLGAAQDSDYALFAPRLGHQLCKLEWPKHPGDHVHGPAEWIRLAPGPSVWITNPSGNSIRAFAGVGDNRDIVAVFLQGY